MTFLKTFKTKNFLMGKSDLVRDVQGCPRFLFQIRLTSTPPTLPLRLEDRRHNSIVF